MEGALSGVTDAISTIMGVVTSVTTAITGSPILMLFLSASIVGIGVGVFRKLKG